MESIPIVDLAPITHAREGSFTPQNLEETAEQIRQALHEIGFVYLVSHGVPSDAINSAFNVSSKFFNLNPTIKGKYRKIPVVSNHGWIQAGQELLHPSSIYELREAFDFASNENGEIVESPEFNKVMECFKKACGDFMKKIFLPLLSSSLQLEDINFFNKCSKHLEDAKISNETDLRVIYYPPLPKDTDSIPKGTIRCAEHTDYELCTLLFQDDQGGLEVQNSNGTWIPATPLQGAILVNTGDLLEKWTAGFYPATKHRVTIPQSEIDKKTARYSFAYFFAPDDDTVVKPLVTLSKIVGSYCKSNGGKTDEEEITAYDHIMKRVKSAYQY